jgi:hypothetical protein
MLRYCLAVFTCLFCSFGFECNAETPIPRFEDHPAKEPFAGPPTAVDLSSHPKAMRFKTAITEGAARGPNFAGHYTFVTWGCGTACQELAIVDAKSGRVYFPTSLKLNAYHMVRDGTDPFRFKRDSDLLVVTGSPNDGEKLGTFYFVWRENQLKKIGEIEQNFDTK